MSKPVAGQWYDLNGSRIWFIGYDACGVAFAQGKNTLPFIMSDADVAKLTHLPDCTGWDWQPETWPQYWSSVLPDTAFNRRDNKHDAVRVLRDGSELKWEYEWERHDLSKDYKYTRLTEQQALALLDPKPVPETAASIWASFTADRFAGSASACCACTGECDQIGFCPLNGAFKCLTRNEALAIHDHREVDEETQEALKWWRMMKQKKAESQHQNKPQPAEDLEEWVEITDPEHVLRENIDFVSYKEQENWYPVTAWRGTGLQSSRFKARCRRKDLPKTRRTITVPKWIIIDDQGLTFVLEQSEAPSGSSYVEVSKVGETTYEIEE